MQLLHCPPKEWKERDCALCGRYDERLQGEVAPYSHALARRVVGLLHSEVCAVRDKLACRVVGLLHFEVCAFEDKRPSRFSAAARCGSTGGGKGIWRGVPVGHRGGEHRKYWRRGAVILGSGGF